MRRAINGKWRGVPSKMVFFLSTSALIICIATSLYKFTSFWSQTVSSSDPPFYHQTGLHSSQPQIKSNLEAVIQKLHQRIDQIAKDDDPDHRNRAFFADILGQLQSIHSLLPQNVYQENQYRGETHEQMSNQIMNRNMNRNNPLIKSSSEYGRQLEEPADFFLIEEIRKYVKMKPNRLKKQNFMGANGTFTSIGHACFAMREDLEKYMDYDVGELCNDDWKLGQKLMVHGCDPLPRRRCLARAPRLYAKPLPLPRALWTLPDDRNVRWSHYRCKSFKCLESNSTSGKKGFAKCASCFDLKNHESPRWVQRDRAVAATKSSPEVDFLIPDVLGVKEAGEIRIGVDFSVGTGSFAARMREYNVTVVTAGINLGAPFSETIAQRGLVPLYLTINQRLPFFDNTMDLIHTTRFLDGWIDLVLLDFVLYDWDRVLRPGGILWVDGFFCLKEDLGDYLKAFAVLPYKKHRWVVAPKTDRGGSRQEVFFSAVLEKRARPF